MTVVSGLSCNIRYVTVNHGILYCSCRHRQSRLDLKQFRVSLMITFSGREFQSPVILWLKKEPRNIEPKAFLVDLLAVAPGPSMYRLMEEEPGLDSVHTAHDLMDLDHIAASSPMHQ